MNATPAIISTPKQMQTHSNAALRAGQRIGLVPTMGALHRGHCSLIDYTRQHCDLLVVSIFINPIQFDRAEDLNRYPRTWAQDLELCRRHQVDLIYAPDAEQMYPAGFQSQVKVQKTTQGLCGATRPGHFNGVTTVVLKLFNAVKPQIVAFGEKDFQQLRTIQRMAKDLDLDIEVVGRPTVREPDGLAKSSRNRLLNDQERQRALCLYRGLQKARNLCQGGELDSDVLIEAAKGEIAREQGVRLDYLSLVDEHSVEPMNGRVDRPARMALAAYLGSVRLIDNLRVN